MGRGRRRADRRSRSRSSPGARNATHPALVRLAIGAAALYAIQVVIGGAQVLTRLAAWTQTLHLALGAVIWALMAGLVVTSYYTARVGAGATSGAGTGWPTRTAGPRTPGDTIRAYIALTKPRIIELLLVTTVPAMVLATRARCRGIAWPGLGRARRLDDDRRHARRRQRERDQLLPRPRHRRADDAHAATAAAGPPGRAGAGGRVRDRARRASRSPSWPGS